jgi:Glycosyltransferase Family 4
VKVAFDSRPRGGPQGIGHYSRCLLRALRETAGERDEITETHRPRGVEVFHAPWIEGAMLHSPCPMVVTVHDVGALTRRSERLRCGGMHLSLRHLALQRATHFIVPSGDLAQEAVAELGLEHERVFVIPLAPDPGDARRPSPAVVSTPLPAAPRPSSAVFALSPAAPEWTWQDAGRATWRVYAEALARPERPCIGGLSKRLAVRAPRGRS